MKVFVVRAFSGVRGYDLRNLERLNCLRIVIDATRVLQWEEQQLDEWVEQVVMKTKPSRPPHHREIEVRVAYDVPQLVQLVRGVG